MKKTIVMMLAMAALSTAIYASPQTTFRPGETEINVGMWDASTNTKGYKSDGEWNFLGGVTYGITDKWAAQYQYTGLHTDHTSGNMNEINALYSFHPQVAAFGGWNRISLKDYPGSIFHDGKVTNNILQVGVVARQPLNEVVDVYAKGALGTEETSMWEAGVNLALDHNLDLNAGYHYINTRGNSDRNVSFKGFQAGVSYRFGGHDPVVSYEEPTKSYDFDEEEEEPSVSVIRTNDSTKKADQTAQTVAVPADEPVAAPENDYYFNSVHFGSDSAALTDAQKVNLDAFVKQAKATGHVFKLVGRADPTGSADYNKELAGRRIKAVKDYAVSQGVDGSKLVEMIKGADDAATNHAEARRVDIFEHK